MNIGDILILGPEILLIIYALITILFASFFKDERSNLFIFNCTILHHWGFFMKSPGQVLRGILAGGSLERLTLLFHRVTRIESFSPPYSGSTLRYDHV